MWQCNIYGSILPDLSLIQSLLIQHMELSQGVINVVFVRTRERESDHRIQETKHSIKAETKEADKEVYEWVHFVL